MTSYEITPIAPPSLGEVIADPGAWQEWALYAPAVATTAPVWRPGCFRALARGAALVAATALLSIGCSNGATASDRVSRPSWDGRHPRVWVAEADPVCWRGIAGRHGWVQLDGRGARWRAACQRGGRLYVWDVVPGSAR